MECKNCKCSLKHIPFDKQIVYSIKENGYVYIQAFKKCGNCGENNVFDLSGNMEIVSSYKD